MPTDTQIHSTQVEAAPLDYPVPLNAELLLKAVNATFADNGAAGDWLPCLTLISDAGSVIARAVDQGVKVTAGSDAEVSWFPGVKRAAAAATASTGLAVGWASVSNPGALGPGQVFPTWGQFHTNDATVFSLNAADHRFVNCATAGTFLVAIGVTWFTQPTTITSPVASIANGFDTNSTALNGIFGHCFNIQDATVGDPKEVTSENGYDVLPAQGLFPPLSFYAELDLTAAQTFGGIAMVVVRLSTL